MASVAFTTAPSSGMSASLTVRRPRPIALTAAANVATRNHKRQLPLRRAFAERPDNLTEPTPLARLLRGGRGGSVRLRLYLSFLRLRRPAARATYPARAWPNSSTSSPRPLAPAESPTQSAGSSTTTSSP